MKIGLHAIRFATKIIQVRRDTELNPQNYLRSKEKTPLVVMTQPAWLREKRHILRHINSFFLVLLDAFSSRFFKTNVLFLYTLFSSTYLHQFHVSSTFCFFCLARCSFRLFPNFRWDALRGIYSDVTLPYLKLMQSVKGIDRSSHTKKDGVKCSFYSF